MYSNDDDQRRRDNDIADQRRRDADNAAYERRREADDAAHQRRREEEQRVNEQLLRKKIDDDFKQNDQLQWERSDEADRKHWKLEDEYREKQREEQGQHVVQERQRNEQAQRQRQSDGATRHQNADGSGILGIAVLALLGSAAWALWAGLQTFGQFTQQWQAYDIPLRWVGQFYRTSFDTPVTAAVNVAGASTDFALRVARFETWVIGAVMAALVAVLGLISLLAKSKLIRCLFAICTLVLLFPGLFGMLWLGLPHDSAASARAWIKAQSFYTAKLNGAEIDASVVTMSNWLACSSYEPVAFPTAALNTLVRGKVLVPFSVPESIAANPDSRVSIFKPFKAGLVFAGQTVREVRVIEGLKPLALEVDFVGIPTRVLAVNAQYRRPVIYYPDGPKGEQFAFTDGHSGYREVSRGKVVGYENALRTNVTSFTARCPK